MIGKVIRTLQDKGFGFIMGDDKREYFFHRSAVRGAHFEEMQTGVAVEFRAEEKVGKGPRAEDIHVL